MKNILTAWMLACCWLLSPLIAGDRIDLAGDWTCLPDAGDVGLMDDWASGGESFPHRVKLPGTTDLAGLGEHRRESAPFSFHLTRKWEFVGPAWYAREIEIPESWQGCEADVVLERVMWQSRAWVDGVEVGSPVDSLCVPHVRALGKLTAGRHRIVLRVDNRMIHPIGDKGHAYGDQTQSRWNGIVGGIELRMTPEDHIDLVRVFPSLEGKVKVEVSGVAKPRSGLRLGFEVNDPAGRETSGSGESDQLVFENAAGDAVARFTAVCELQGFGNVRQWSEFNPDLYHLKVSLHMDREASLDRKSVVFGFREVTRDGNKLLINGRPAFMRGNLECAVFPKTGHPPTDVEDWRRIWKIYQDHGLNHARFHSWCPPEAAFAAADELGIYLQVEAPIWMDHWMAAPNSRPEMDTAGHPKGLGKGDRSNDAFARSEIRRILDTYGNHPSFVFFCIGNELGTSDFKVTGGWIADAKQHDPRHLYAASTARTITSHCDFNATHAVPGIGSVRQHLEFGTNWDYEAQYGKTAVPIIAHEIGQWPVYVDWNADLPRYSGPLAPYRLLTMKGQAEAAGLLDQARDLRQASGASNRLLYRDEIESFLRTPSCRGFQLLGMQDFTGQGEAMIGWLDPFYQSKGTTTAQEFRRYCAPTVPLLKLPGYVFSSSAKPTIPVLLHHYGNVDLPDAAVSWKLLDPENRVVTTGSLANRSFPAGGVHACGSFSPSLDTIRRAGQYSIELTIAGFSNSYPLWVYPELKTPAKPDRLLVADDWNTEVRAELQRGGKVVLMAGRLGGRDAAKHGHWQPLYWSVPFFPGQNRDTLGLLVREDHPVFADFPTGGFGDWNWFRICQGARGFDLTDITPRDFRPMAQPVTDFHLNRRLGSIFELRVGTGALLVCGYDLDENRTAEFPEVGALRESILNYASSARFDPQVKIGMETLGALFADPDSRPLDVPGRFSKADLYIRCAGRLAEGGKSLPWRSGEDAVLLKHEGLDYQVVADGIWKDPGGTAWHGKSMNITIKPRSGVPGKLFVRFHDWNRNGRTGKLVFEGVARNLPAHVEGVWVEFPVIREDSNDGRLVLTTEALSGPNLMITDLAFVPEE